MAERFIDVETAKILAEEFYPFVEGCAETRDVKDFLNCCPTVEVKPVVHAHWIVTEKYGVKDYVCGNCSDEEYWQKHWLNHNANFCPHCGAKMD